MKKLLPFLAAILLLQGWSAVQKQPSSPPPIPAAFTADIAVTFGDYAVTALFTQNSFSDFKLKMLTPPSLEPLEISFLNDSCTVTYDNLKFETDLKRFPQTAFGSLLTDALGAAASSTDINISYADGIWTYTGTGSAGDFIFTQDNATGAWLTLTIESAQLKIVFSNFKPL